MTMTKKESVPLKLWMDSAEEMRIISNKRQSLVELFEWLDFRQLKRIDTMQLFAAIVCSIDGRLEQIINSKKLSLTLQTS
jgi:hypothetical protein